MDAFPSGRTRAIIALLAAALCGLALLTPNLHWIAVKAQTLPPGEPQPDLNAQANTDVLQWTLEYTLPANERQTGALAVDSLKTLLSAKISDPGVAYQIDPATTRSGAASHRVSLKGSGGLRQFRQVVWTDLKDQVRLLSGPADVILSGQAAQGQNMPVLLDGNLSTGYSWNLSADSSAGLSAPVSYGPVSGLLGSPQQIRIPLQARAGGAFNAHLVYRRAFEPADQWDTRITLQGDTLPAAIDLSNPDQPIAAQTTLAVPPDASAQTVLSGDLPAQYDWRQSAALTPVRDQGGCGSCWAFGTVGLLESALAIQDNSQVDLSEQYLISCNDYNFGCGGGWWNANDYHQSAFKSPPQTSAGAVLESDLSYTASDSSCKAAYSHPYQIRNWNYIKGYWPSVADIKQAILTYGPVGTSLCVGNSFGTYQGGIFDKDESAACGGGINHAVVLVGWDDNNGQGYWILRNSWGSGWGEGGYMRMRYNISNIGYMSVYVDYLLKPSVPRLLSPADGTLVTESRPSFSWSSGQSTQGYEFQLATDSTFTGVVESAAADLPAYTAASDVKRDTRYYWRVRGWMDISASRLYSSWSTPRSFITSPDKPVLAAPADGQAVDVLRPELSWTGLDGITQYDLQISPSSTFSTLLLSTPVTGQSYRPAVNLPRSATLHWRVRARGIFGSGSWSSPFSLVTPNPPAAPLLSLPAAGAVVRPDRSVELKWFAVSGASGYEIQLSSSSLLTSPVSFPEQSQVSLVLDGSLNPNSLYTWRVRAFNGEPKAYGPWSVLRSLKTTPEIPVPAIPAAGAPVDSLRPAFSWSEPGPALRYDLEIHRNSGCSYLLRSATLLAGPAYTPGADLPRKAVLFWRVRARGLYGAGGWSACQSFVLPDPPSVPVLSSPISGAILPVSQPFRPTLVWNPSTHGVLSYQLQLSATSSFEGAGILEGISSPYSWPSDLATGVYRWRVRAVGQDANGPIYSSWSAVRIFKTPAALQGTVSDAASGAPLANVTVTIAGTPYSAFTGTDGKYFIPVAPAGLRSIYARSGGYIAAGKSYTILAGGVRTVNFSLKKAAP